MFKIQVFMQSVSFMKIVTVIVYSIMLKLTLRHIDQPFFVIRCYEKNKKNNDEVTWISDNTFVQLKILCPHDLP